MNSCRNFILTARDQLRDAFLRVFKIGTKFCPTLTSRVSISMQLPLTDLSVDPVTLADISMVQAWCIQDWCQDIFISHTWQEEIKTSKHAFGRLALSCLCHLRQRGFSFKGLILKTLVMYSSTDGVKLTGVNDKPLPAGASELQNDKLKCIKLRQNRPCTENMAISTFLQNYIST